MGFVHWRTSMHQDERDKNKLQLRALLYQARKPAILICVTTEAAHLESAAFLQLLEFRTPANAHHIILTATQGSFILSYQETVIV